MINTWETRKVEYLLKSSNSTHTHKYTSSNIYTYTYMSSSKYMHINKHVYSVFKDGEQIYIFNILYYVMYS